ncbi:MAG: peptidoglycan D,D-transpeptidase FtsI family protein, partial [Pseudomonadales bacterium]
VLVLFLGACSGVAARVVYLNVSDRAFLQEQGNARSIRHETLPAYRGVIYDRNGEALAVSTPVAAIWTDPSFMRLSADAIEAVAAILDLNPTTLAANLEANARREFMYLKRRVPWETAEQLRALKLDGVFIQREYRRYYPAAQMAAHLVGMTSIDDLGLEGIELSYDEYLRGRPGRKTVLKDRRGETIKDLEYGEPPRFGTDITLSIDLRLQFMAYRELKAAVAGNRAESGSLVMLDVRTGEVLALVNEPSYNPNDLASANRGGMRNRAVTDTYEPGSTIKPFTVLAALESNRWHPQTPIDTAPGFMRVGTKLVQDPINRGTITLLQALQKSSQVGISKVALDLPPTAVFDVLTRAGVAEFIGTGLPGEAAGRLSDQGLDHPVVRATLAYGYGLAISPLQLAQGYLTLARGGERVPISILKRENPPAGEVVFDRALSLSVLDMMEAVTDDAGTAPRARVPGYRVAGKTGTSRKVGERGYDDERHVALFAGLAPLSNPRIVMVVVINEPGGVAIGGGTVAAPVFGQVAARALRLLGVRPDGEVAI